jgi:hypothetical protein
VKNFVVIPQSTLENHPVNSFLSPNQKTIYNDLVSSGVPSDKAIELSKLNSTLSEMMALSKKAEFSHEDLWLMLRSSLMDTASASRSEKEVLINGLAIL